VVRQDYGVVRGMMGAGTHIAKSWTNSKIGHEYWSALFVAWDV
jgi:hypothetical protein